MPPLLQHRTLARGEVMLWQSVVQIATKLWALTSQLCWSFDCVEQKPTFLLLSTENGKRKCNILFTSFSIHWRKLGAYIHFFPFLLSKKTPFLFTFGFTFFLKFFLQIQNRNFHPDLKHIIATIVKINGISVPLLKLY